MLEALACCLDTNYHSTVRLPIFSTDHPVPTTLTYRLLAWVYVYSAQPTLALFCHRNDFADDTVGWGYVFPIRIHQWRHNNADNGCICLFLASECAVMFPSRLPERLLVRLVAAQEPLVLVTTFYVHPAHLASNLNPAYNARDQDRGI